MRWLNMIGVCQKSMLEGVTLAFVIEKNFTHEFERLVKPENEKEIMLMFLEDMHRYLNLEKMRGKIQKIQ